MNMALWAVCAEARRAGRSVVGLRDGFAGLLERDALPLDADAVLPWARRGGTFLGTARLPDLPSRRSEVRNALDGLGICDLVVLGGNGSLAAAEMLADDVKTVVGMPATIDNDVADCPASIGFDSALATAVRLADGIRDSGEALPRLFSLETLGGDTGFLATAVARAVCADAVLIPEAPREPAEVAAELRPTIEAGRAALIVASEGYPELGAFLHEVSSRLGLRLRDGRIGHAQRGGAPSPRDRLLARDLGEEAVRAIVDGVSCRVVPSPVGPVRRVHRDPRPKRSG
jgi:6-phosphofructokinase 1